MTQYESLIPLPDPVYRLADAFRRHGYVLLAVGGVVRDYLMHKEHVDSDPTAFNPKDVDLCTNATPEEIESILNAENIRNFGKGESFGVWVAHVAGEDFEIATFREDIGVGDGRHPESVRFVTCAEDYCRRDLTINALYYEIPERGMPGIILDFGTGLEDVVRKRVRVVGNPMDRFNEDKLRILRFVRFYCRYRTDEITAGSIGEATWQAILHFRDLRLHNISGPRIMTEFSAGLSQAIDPVVYVRCLERIGLMPAVFPAVAVRTDKLSYFERYEQVRDVALVAAHLLRMLDAREASRVLNQLNYPGEVFNEVGFLLRAYHKLRTPPDDDTMVRLALDMDKAARRRWAFGEFGRSVAGEVHEASWKFLENYRTRKYNGDILMTEYQIPEGPELGRKMHELHLEDLKRGRTVA